MPSSRARGPAPKDPSAPATVHRLRVTLEGITPPIWRDLVVPSNLHFGKLHDVLQAAMPWANSHLHMFRLGERTIGDPSPEDDFPVEDERRVTLQSLAPMVGAKFLYEYDFGDSWTHRIDVVGIDPAAPGTSPHCGCAAGARAAPQEDCGGISGYAELLRALVDPKHKRHIELTEWLTWYRAELATFDARFKGPFDPEAFDLAATDAAVRKAGRGRR